MNIFTFGITNLIFAISIMTSNASTQQILLHNLDFLRLFALWGVKEMFTEMINCIIIKNEHCKSLLKVCKFKSFFYVWVDLWGVKEIFTVMIRIIKNEQCKSRLKVCKFKSFFTCGFSELNILSSC